MIVSAREAAPKTPSFGEFESLFEAAEAGLNVLELPAHVIPGRLGDRDLGTFVTAALPSPGCAALPAQHPQGSPAFRWDQAAPRCGRGRCLTAHGYARHGAPYVLSQEAPSNVMRCGLLGCTSVRT